MLCQEYIKLIYSSIVNCHSNCILCMLWVTFISTWSICNSRWFGMRIVWCLYLRLPKTSSSHYQLGVNLFPSERSALSFRMRICLSFPLYSGTQRFLHCWLEVRFTGFINKLSYKMWLILHLYHSEIRNHNFSPPKIVNYKCEYCE